MRVTLHADRMLASGSCAPQPASPASGLRRDRGKHSEARDLLAPFYGWFIEGFGTPVLDDAKALLVRGGLVPVISASRTPRPSPS